MQKPINTRKNSISKLKIALQTSNPCGHAASWRQGFAVRYLTLFFRGWTCTTSVGGKSVCTPLSPAPTPSPTPVSVVHTCVVRMCCLTAHALGAYQSHVFDHATVACTAHCTQALCTFKMLICKPPQQALAPEPDANNGCLDCGKLLLLHIEILTEVAAKCPGAIGVILTVFFDRFQLRVQQQLPQG
jgi:hypothetical protein